MTRAQTLAVLAASATCFVIAGVTYWGGPAPPLTGGPFARYVQACIAHRVFRQCERSMERWGTSAP